MFYMPIYEPISGRFRRRQRYWAMEIISGMLNQKCLGSLSQLSKTKTSNSGALPLKFVFKVQIILAYQAVLQAIGAEQKSVPASSCSLAP